MGETRNVGLPICASLWPLEPGAFPLRPIWQEPLGRITQSVKAWHLVITTAAILAFAGFVIGRAGLWIALSVSVLALLSRAYFQRRRAEINHDQLGALVEVCETISFILLASLVIKHQSSGLMDLFKPLSPVIPVFLLVGTGFIFAHWKKSTSRR